MRSPNVRNLSEFAAGERPLDDKVIDTDKRPTGETSLVEDRSAQENNVTVISEFRPSSTAKIQEYRPQLGRDLDGMLYCADSSSASSKERNSSGTPTASRIYTPSAKSGNPDLPRKVYPEGNLSVPTTAVYSTKRGVPSSNVKFSNAYRRLNPAHLPTR